MKSDEFRAIQAPLKEKYKEAPSAALITLKAQGRIGEGITCKVVFQTLQHSPIIETIYSTQG